MRIDRLSTNSAGLQLKGLPRIDSSGNTQATDASKTIGETPPLELSLSEIGEMAALFAPSGLIGRLKKRLNHLKKRNCEVVPAEGTIACVDDNGEKIYLGINFVREQTKDRQHGEETLAGVLAHEIGHTCAVKPNPEEVNAMNWDQIFALRREHETLADEIAGRLLFLMGYKPDGLVNFLTKTKGETHNYKYHPPEIRAQVILKGFAAEKQNARLARDLFKDAPNDNPYKGTLLDIA